VGIETLSTINLSQKTNIRIVFEIRSKQWKVTDR
jgi:hypothetical protein